MLKDQVAIVTGAGRGIGRAIALRIAAQGARVALAARNIEQLTETRRLVEAAGGTAIAIPTDVSLEAPVGAMVSETLSRFGRIDVLINNAGVALTGTTESMDADTFDRLIAGNVRSVYLCCHAVWPHMKRAGRGTIVNISSIAAQDPFPGLGAYGATKLFVNLYTRSMAGEGAPHGIRVHGIAPGAVETQMLRGFIPDFPENQTLSPDDVAATVEMMLTPAAAPMSGQTIVVKKDA